MPPPKPTRSSNRRAGLPKQDPAESLSPAVSGIGTLNELPSDLGSLAMILESAMRQGSRGGMEEVAAPRAEIANPGPEIPDPKSQTSHPKPQIENPGSQSVIPDDELPRPQSPIPELRLAVPDPVPGKTSEPEAAAFDEVARSLAAAEACVPLLAQSTGLMRLAALDVVKAETARAGWLLHLLRFLRGDVSPPMTAVSTAVVTQRVAQAAEAERRLRGIALTSRSNVADATCTGDETLLTNVVLALLLITFAVIEHVQNARVTLSVTVNDQGEIGLAISQDHVPAPPAWISRTGLEELPGDADQVVPAIAIKAAQRLAVLWNGRFATASGEHSSILTLWLPTLQLDDQETLAH
jgi:hypothetical protein